MKGFGNIDLWKKALMFLVAPFLFSMIFSGVVDMRDNFGIPMVYGYSALYVATDSMAGEALDSLPQGTGIILQRVSPENLREGDVVSFFDKRIGAINTHRLISDPSFAGEHFRFHTMGDNRKSALFSYEGERFTEKELIGKVIWHSSFISFFLACFSPSVSAMAEASERMDQAFLFPLFTLLPLGILSAVISILSLKEWFFGKEKERSFPALANFAMSRVGGCRL